jgi:glycosyltransferase involved in cell wall biosynthesis
MRKLAGAGFRITFLSYEKPADLRDRGSVAALKSELAVHGIEWLYLKYHKSPGILAKAYDILCGAAVAIALGMRRKFEIIHARSTIPAAIAFIASRLLRCRYIFDLRGLLAEEYADGGLWERGSFKYRLVDGTEKRLLRNAGSIVVLTERIRKTLVEDKRYFRGAGSPPITVIPCCVDLGKFVSSGPSRDSIRARLSLGDDFVIGYLGSIGTWYMLEEMLDFFDAVKGSFGKRCRFVILTQTREAASGHDRLAALLADNSVTIDKVRHSDVPAYLSAMDAGLIFIKSCFSKTASSPTKFAEFLACGIPVVVNSGVGDMDGIIRREKVGVIAEGFSRESYRAAAEALKGLLEEGGALKRRCRGAAENIFSLDGGCRQYEKVYRELIDR